MTLASRMRLAVPHPTGRCCVGWGRDDEFFCNPWCRSQSIRIYSSSGIYRRKQLFSSFREVDALVGQTAALWPSAMFVSQSLNILKTKDVAIIQYCRHDKVGVISTH